MKRANKKLPPVAVEIARDPKPDEWLKISEAVCLQEFGGQLFFWGQSKPGVISEGTLRSAIDKGDIVPIRA